MSSFLSSLQDTPRPKSRNSPPGNLFVEEEFSLPVENRSVRKSNRSTSVHRVSSSRPSDSQPELQLILESSDPRSTDPSATKQTQGPDAQAEVGVIRPEFDPNFIYEWRQKYLKGSAVDSSTPRRNFAEVEDAVSDLDVSRISAERAPDAVSRSSGASDTVLSDIDDSALKQAREVLRQLDSSRRNLEKTQNIISQMESKQKHKAEQSKLNDSNNNVKSRSDGHRNRSRNSNRHSGAVIEGDDILEEAKRVLREINSSSEMSSKSNRSNASRNLINSFDEIFKNEAVQKGVHSPVANLDSTKRSPKKSFAPNSLSNLATNELDYLEDCNDTLLKISEVSRAKNYAFAKETNVANEFLRRVSIESNFIFFESFDRSSELEPSLLELDSGFFAESGNYSTILFLRLGIPQDEHSAPLRHSHSVDERRHHGQSAKRSPRSVR